MALSCHNKGHLATAIASTGTAAVARAAAAIAASVAETQGGNMSRDVGMIPGEKHDAFSKCDASLIMLGLAGKGMGVQSHLPCQFKRPLQAPVLCF